MALYRRPDSPYWWMLIEGADVRLSTKIRWDGDTPGKKREQKRKADIAYAKELERWATILGESSDKPAISFRTFRDWYDTHHAAHLRGVTRVQSILTQLGKHFDGRSLHEIDADAIREWMTKRKREVEPSTVNRELDVLKSLLNAAVPRYLDASPAAQVRRFRVEEAEPRVLTVDEETRLLAVGSDADRAWITLALDTLLRLSNTVDLKWAQVKLDARVIVPLNAKVSHDIVPISTRLAVALTNLPRQSDYVFPAFREAKKGGAQAAKQLAIRRFAHLCALAGIPHGRGVNGITFHCLRHTGATRALQAGASVRTVMKLGGWKMERMVMRYVHASDADVRQAAESIGHFLGHLSATSDTGR